MKQFILFLFVLLPFCVSSQVNEMFDGPEIGVDWIGRDRGLFYINADGRLQLNIKPTTPGSASIGKEITYSSDMQWEFDVYMLYAPSEDNKLCVYLYQESPDCYYYVRLGYSGSKKFGLMRFGEKDLFDRQTNDFKKVPALLHVKVTLEDNKQWTLYSRTDEMAGYKLEGSGSYPIVEPQEQGNLVFTFHYTKTRSNLFSIDNVYVSDQITPTPLEPEEEPEEPEQPDEEIKTPSLPDLEQENATELLLIFHDPVDPVQYQITLSEVGDADEVYISEDSKILKAVWKEALLKGQTYTLYYSGIFDKSGNECKGDTTFISAYGEEKPEPGKPGTILINEIMADPNGLKDLAKTEYIELYNMSGKELSLKGWQLIYGKEKPKSIGNVSIPVAGYMVLYRSGRDMKVDNQGIAVPMDDFPSQLANAGKDLQLWDASGNVIDDVTYAKATAGKSWERSASGWHLSTDPRGGTPGSVNSSPSSDEEEPPVDPDKPEEPDKPDTPVVTDPILPGEIVFNELLPDPYAGGSEYLELYNRSGKPLSVSTLSLAVRKSDGTLSTRYPLAAIVRKLEAGSYILLTKDVESVSSFYEIAEPSALHQLSKLPILANTASTLVLFRTADGEVIDEVSYSSKWHASSVKNRKGVALERIDPDAATQNPANWTSASETAGFGTPGYQNSQYGNPSSEGSTGIEPPVWIEESGSYRMSYLLDRPGYNCRAFVFNTSGIRVAEIANLQLLGTSGELTWSGIANSGSALPPGIYIFYAEIYHPDGVVKRYKKAFLIR